MLERLLEHALAKAESAAQLKATGEVTDAQKVADLMSRLGRGAARLDQSLAARGPSAAASAAAKPAPPPVSVDGNIAI